MEDQLAARGRCIDALGEAAERDASCLNGLDGVDQVPEAAAQPVQPPDDDGVTGRSWSKSVSSWGRCSSLPEALSVKIRGMWILDMGSGTARRPATG